MLLRVRHLNCPSLAFLKQREERGHNLSKVSQSHQRLPRKQAHARSPPAWRDRRPCSLSGSRGAPGKRGPGAPAACKLPGLGGRSPPAAPGRPGSAAEAARAPAPPAGRPPPSPRLASTVCRRSPGSRARRGARPARGGARAARGRARSLRPGEAAAPRGPRWARALQGRRAPVR